MKMAYKFATLHLVVLALSICGFAQRPPKKIVALNLERGVVGPVASNNSWSGYSALNQVPGGGLIPNTSANTVFYLGFAAGSTADISNMVLYTTARGGNTITAVTPVTLGGISHPSINLASKTVCPVQPPSASNPCIVRLDPTALTLSALSDYYLVVYFTAGDSNNSALGAAQPSTQLSSLHGWFIGADETQLSVGGSIPSGCCQPPLFLMFVMTN